MVIECPECGHNTVKRVMDTVIIDEAEYIDGKLKVTEIQDDVRESYICCGNKNCEHVMYEEEETYEELFL